VVTSNGVPLTPATEICVLIPAYNEARHVQAVVAAARRYAPVLVVDDGSTDGTAQQAEAAGARVWRQTPNQGKGAALRAGFRLALQEGYRAVITLDADGQHDPDEIPPFLAVFAARMPDLIVGARDFHQMPLVRRIANTVGGWFFSWALGIPVRDNQSGYRLLTARLMKAVLESVENGFEFEVEMIVQCVKRHYVLEWVPIRTIYGNQASHIQPWHHTVNFFRVVWQSRQAMAGRARVSEHD
jgi:glycosyltransferase involved in cell wall biosynthesis